MKNVALTSIILVYHAITCDVFANNYILLSSFDKLCKERHDKGFVANYVVDDITIREQLVLSWPGDLNTSSFYNPPRNPKFALCPGLVIHPSGRFVKRSFPEGLALFWLLRANIHFTCPKNAHLSESFYLQLEQWIESLEWNTKHWRQDALKDQDGDTIDSTSIGEAPDEILLINCSSSYVGQSNHWSLSGYLRRIRITWKLRNETEVTDLTTITNTSLSSTSSSSSVIFLNTSFSDSSLPSPSQFNNLNNQHLSRSGIKFLVRISSHMLFVGNFSMERQKALCEFFSGFWCLQSLSTSNTTSTNHHHQDNQSSLLSSSTSMSSSPLTSLPNQYNILSSKHPICVQATMLCDSLPDCDLRVPMNEVNLSLDEANCNMIPSNYSLKTSKSYKDDHWISKLPWIILAPVPVILICALIRICSQKRQLDMIEDNNININNHNEWSTVISSSTVTTTTTTTTNTNHCDKCLHMQYKKLPTNYFIIKRKLRNYQGSIPGILNRINKLSSVTEVDDEIDSNIDQQVNILKMKPLNNNNNNNDHKFKTKSANNSNRCDNLLQHCYSLPEFTIKHHDNDDNDDDNVRFNSDLMCYSVNNVIISNRNFHAISTCSSREASFDDNGDDDDDDRLNINQNLITHYQSIEAFNKSKSCNSLHETKTQNERMNYLSISPCSSTSSSIDYNNNDDNKRNHVILSDSPSDNNQFIQNSPKSIIFNQYSNDYLLSNIKFNNSAQYNMNDNNQYHKDIIKYYYYHPSRNISLSSTTTTTTTTTTTRRSSSILCNYQEKFNYIPLNASSSSSCCCCNDDNEICYCSSMNTLEIPRNISILSKCINYIHHQLMNSTFKFNGNYIKNHYVYNSKTKIMNDGI
ncbi:unnamed protein product [Schistosoma spindalis]|nr:unnamed protein product [Schistosoma spindale]